MIEEFGEPMPTTIQRYRQVHTIAPVKVTRAGHLTPVYVCDHDGVRVHPKRRNTGWYHDPTEIREAERGHR